MTNTHVASAAPHDPGGVARRKISRFALIALFREPIVGGGKGERAINCSEKQQIRKAAVLIPQNLSAP